MLKTNFFWWYKNVENKIKKSWCKKPIKNWDADVDNISKLIETKNYYNYLIGNVKAFKDEKNKVTSFCINNHKLLEKHKIILIKMKELQNFLNDRCVKCKIRIYGHQVYTNFHD